MKLTIKQRNALTRWDKILDEELAKKPSSGSVGLHVRKAIIEIILLLDDVGD
jgi:hypothetical protein